MILSAYDRMATAPCPGFQWIGQRRSSCDGCGRPYWRHSHDERYRGKGPWNGRILRVPITRAQAERASADYYLEGMLT